MNSTRARILVAGFGMHFVAKLVARVGASYSLVIANSEEEALTLLDEGNIALAWLRQGGRFSAQRVLGLAMLIEHCIDMPVVVVAEFWPREYSRPALTEVLSREPSLGEFLMTTRAVLDGSDLS